MTSHPRQIIETQYGKLVVVVSSGNEARVHSTGKGNQEGEDFPFTVNGVRLKVDAHLHAPGTCTRGCREGNHGPAGNQWGFGELADPKRYSHQYDKIPGEVNGYSSYPTVRRYEDDFRTATDAAQRVVRTVVPGAVTQLLGSQPWVRDRAVRVLLEMSLSGAQARVEHLQKKLAEALVEWQATEDALASFDSNSEAA